MGLDVAGSVGIVPGPGAGTIWGSGAWPGRPMPGRPRINFPVPVPGIDDTGACSPGDGVPGLRGPIPGPGLPAGPDGPPATLPMQPEPDYTLVLPVPEANKTGLVRGWKPGDAARCQLCPGRPCVARKPPGGVLHVCGFVVPGLLTDGEAPLYRRPGPVGGDGPR